MAASAATWTSRPKPSTYSNQRLRRAFRRPGPGTPSIHSSFKLPPGLPRFTSLTHTASNNMHTASGGSSPACTTAKTTKAAFQGRVQAVAPQPGSEVACPGRAPGALGSGDGHSRMPLATRQRAQFEPYDEGTGVCVLDTRKIPRTILDGHTTISSPVSPYPFPPFLHGTIEHGGWRPPSRYPSAPSFPDSYTMIHV